MDKREAKKKANRIKASIRIGKDGFTEAVLREIKNQVEKHRVVKIRVNRNFGGKEEVKKVAEELEELGIKVAEVRGRTIVVFS